MMTPCKLVDISPLTRVKWPQLPSRLRANYHDFDLIIQGWTLLGSKIWALWARLKFSHTSPNNHFPWKNGSRAPEKQSYSFFFPVFQEKESPKIPKRTYESFNSMCSFFFKRKRSFTTERHSWAIAGCETRQVPQSQSLRCGTRCWGYDYPPQKKTPV